jgi:hypothetical protein
MRAFVRSGGGTVNRNDWIQTPFPGGSGSWFLSIGTAFSGCDR